MNPALVELCETYSACTRMARPSLSRCFPCSLALSSFNDTGPDSVAYSATSSKAESLPQHTPLSCSAISSAAASAADRSVEGATRGGRLVMTISWLGRKTVLLPSCASTGRERARQEIMLKKAECRERGAVPKYTP